MNVLFVCKGNVGRSQMAAALFLKVSKHEAKSAGIVVGKEHGKKIKEYGEGTKYVIESLKEEGCDVSENSRKQLTPEMVDKADKVIVMSEPEFVPDYLKNKEGVIYWNVNDPKGMSIQDTIKIKNQIKSLVNKLVEERN